MNKFTIGEQVYIPRINKKGVIKKDNTDKEEKHLQYAIMIKSSEMFELLWFRPHDLEKIKGKAKKDE